jgi:formyltetrahydrofolate hydrolase
MNTDSLTEVYSSISKSNHKYLVFFLPAFVGAKPWDDGCERVVKIIGSTSLYVTEELDAGPIIEREVAWVKASQFCS